MRIIVKIYSFVGGNIFLIFLWIAISRKGKELWMGLFTFFCYLPLITFCVKSLIQELINRSF